MYERATVTYYNSHTGKHTVRNHTTGALEERPLRDFDFKEDPDSGTTYQRRCSPSSDLTRLSQCATIDVEPCTLTNVTCT